MWNHSKSLMLTTIWVRLALLLWVGVAVVLPFLKLSPAVLVLFYLVFLPVLLALYGLERLLRNIQQGQVFIRANIAQLRLVSWACFFAAVFLLVGGCLWPVLILVAGSVGFLGLFVRVIKNMLTEAVLLKEENDFTI